MLPPDTVAAVLDAFALGSGTVSPEPAAYGRVGEIWRLEATSGTWALKTEANPVSEAGSAPSVRFHEAAVAAGLPAPAVRRTRNGRIVAQVAGRGWRVLEWVDMSPADPALDPVAVGRLLAELHGMPGARCRGFDGEIDPWFTAPVGAGTWDALIAELGRRDAPFAAAFAAHRDELVALEELLAPPRDRLWCHRDLFADNVRTVPSGGLVVFDFDNSGPCDPAWELGHVVAEFATTAAAGHARVERDRARALVAAYADAGGPARLTGRDDFTMVIAVLGHIAEIAARRWLAADDPAQRDDLAAWAAELTDRPFTRQVVTELLDTVAE